VNEKVPKQDNRYKTETENSTPLNNGITTLPQRIFGLQLLNLTSTAATTHTNTHTHTHTHKPNPTAAPVAATVTSPDYTTQSENIVQCAIYTLCVCKYLLYMNMSSFSLKKTAVFNYVNKKKKVLDDNQFL